MELTEWDIEQLDRMVNGNRNAGTLVETKTGVIGRTYNKDKTINGKVLVYCTNGQKLLCSPNNLIIKGFID